MAASTHVKIGGVWRDIGANGIYVHDAGSWQQCDFVYVNEGGTWRTAYIRDNTGPSAVTNFKATWEANSNSGESTSDGLRITFDAPADADIDYVMVYVKPRNHSTTYTMGPYSCTPSQAKSIKFTAYRALNKIYNVQVVPYDTNGNAGTVADTDSMEWTGAARGRTVSPFYVAPWASNTWRNGSIRTDGTVYQGRSTSGYSFGVYYYANAFHDSLRGATADSARIELHRQNTTGISAAIQPDMYWTNNASYYADAEIVPRYGEFLGSAMDRWSLPYGYSSLPAGWLDNFTDIDLGQTVRSVLFHAPESILYPEYGNVSLTYMSMHGAGVDPYNGIVHGRIGVWHSG